MIRNIIDLAAEFLAAGFVVLDVQEENARADAEAALTIHRPAPEPLQENIVIQVAYLEDALEFGVSREVECSSCAR